MDKTISDEQWRILEVLLNAGESLSVEVIAERSTSDLPVAAATLQYAGEQGWLTIDEQEREELKPAGNAADQLEQGLPERQAIRAFSETFSTERVPMRDLAPWAGRGRLPMNEIIKWGSQRGWFDKDKGELVLTEAGRKALKQPDDDERALELALSGTIHYLDELPRHGIDPDKVRALLKNRGALAKLKSRIRRSAQLTEEGRRRLPELEVVKERNLLTSEDIISGEWRNIRLRRYDVTLEAERAYPAKIHPMQKIIQETRRAFLEMGFTEIVSPQAESAFWDFDALFQPQDHPARDMQDTFYLEKPREARLPDPEIVERIRRTHEDGWETGSTGWGYDWSEKRARQVVMRTHTTASTIRAVAENPEPPRKVFCVGKVYRNEAVSYKHLPEFFQVDGVIIDDNASLVTLLGTLREFYRKMGFEKVKFKPDFFPYTEPSAEVTGWLESKGQWIELGGSGVFRPEVTRPFGCRVPVLAWGLGLDRLAMMRYGIEDIRELYWSDLDLIREAPLCR